MESIRNVVQQIWKKYRYAILILIVGIALLLLPSGNERNTNSPPSGEAVSAKEQKEDDEERLEEILGQIEGVGKVCVMLTTLYGEETVYQTNGNDSSESGHNQTVIITGTDKGQYGLIKRIISPVYLGAIVVCQGGGKAAVKMEVTDAVSKATGLKSNQITVLKME